MSAPHAPDSVNRVASDAACVGGRPAAGERSEVAELVAALGMARALVLTVDTHEGRGDAEGRGSGALLAGLHLDLAAAELADAAGSAGANWVEGPGDRGDGPDCDPAGAGGRLLVQRCLRVLQDRLRRGPAGSPDLLDSHESLSYTRAVLHLHAAQRAWPAAADFSTR